MNSSFRVSQFQALESIIFCWSQTCFLWTNHNFKTQNVRCRGCNGQPNRYLFTLSTN